MKIHVKTEQKYSETEQAILAYLFEYPGGNIGTYSLMKVLKADSNSTEGGWQTPEVQRQAYEEIEFGIETLIKDKLAKGKRATPAGMSSSINWS
jgi:hypothetical protein